MHIPVSFDDPQRDDRIIVQSFIKELCRRDDQDNHGNPILGGRRPNIFPIEEIQRAVLGAFSLDRVRLALRGYILQHRDNEPLELLGDETNVRLTDAGRARCDEYGM
ncbi:MAG: hypothetical protein WBQ25_03165 [Nitrososphaeraceae archaeon]